jgi:hypothetical protein
MLVVAAGSRDIAHAAADLPAYSDSLENSWENWSWASTEFASTAVVHSGSNAIAVTASPFSALWLRHSPFDTTGFGNVTFWINGGATGGQRLHVAATLGDAGQSSGVDLPALPANTWQQFSLPLASLGAADVANFTGFWVQEWAGADQPTYYVDDVVLTGSTPVIPPPALDGGMALFEDSFVNGWDNWSWATINAGNITPVNSGASSLAVRAGPFTALAFHHAALDISGYKSLTFWVNGGQGGQKLLLRALLSGTIVDPGFTLTLAAADPNNPWTKVTIPLSALGVATKSDLSDIWFQEIAGVDQTANPFYIDDIRLDLAPPPVIVNVGVDGHQMSNEIDARMFGLNVEIWDGAFNTPTTADLLTESANTAMRFGGGSLSDAYHWKTGLAEGSTFLWPTNIDAFANVAMTTRAQVFITANYGSGSPEEAADEVRYTNKTKNYGFKYWEIGNENYGSWEVDNNLRPHDPLTYARRFKEYFKQMKLADHTIKIGAVITVDEDSFPNYTDEVVTNPRTGASHSGWSAVLLAGLKQLGVTPDYVIYHRYEQGPGGENDAFLLNSARTWANDAASIRQLLNDYLGADAKKVEIICTENNSVFSNTGKQTTSLVNGLFMADSIANVMKTEFKGFFWWNLRNGQEFSNNNASSLYGWRKYGDYGIVSSAVPAGPADRYPTFYTYKLLQHYARGGETVVAATSDYNGLGVYAVRDRKARTLNLLLINKHPTAPLNVNIAVSGFKVGTQADVFSYGIPQDNAAQTGIGSADVAQSTATLVGSTFTWNPAPYSATVLRIVQSGREDNVGTD